MGVRIWWGVGGVREWYGIEGERRMEDEKKGPDGERGRQCVGGRNRGSRWREERRGNGLGEERPGQGEGQICVCLLRGEGEYK